jgi:hypothetical protein
MDGLMSRESEELRDVAEKIEQLASAHRSWSMTCTIIRNAVDHLTALAASIEWRDKVDGRRD